jgi:hypothetical protein
MTPVYSAAHVTDAHLVKDLLEQAGIRAHVRGGSLQGGLGEIPVTGLIDVCVDGKDAGRAADVLTRWRAGEYALPDVASDEAAPATPDAGGGHGWISTLSSFCFGVAAGALVCWAALRGPEQSNAVDYDEDGRIDEHAYYSGDRLLRVESDRNGDGRIDMVTRYGALAPETGESDDDFDGRMESRHRFRRGQWIETEVDRDGDGAIEYRMDANAGVLSREQWLAPDGTVLKQVNYTHGRATSSELDVDRDGGFDTRRELDDLAEATGTRSIAEPP